MYHVGGTVAGVKVRVLCCAQDGEAVFHNNNKTFWRGQYSHIFHTSAIAKLSDSRVSMSMCTRLCEVGDLANLLGCAMDLPPEITAITIVALGTSLPDTFASRTAAVEDPSERR